jgi:hypothetical protein
MVRSRCGAQHQLRSGCSSKVALQQHQQQHQQVVPPVLLLLLLRAVRAA